MNHSTFRRSHILCAVVALTLSGAATGDELEYGLRAGASYSDNVDRTSTYENASGAAAVGIDLRGARTAGRLLYDVFADVEYRDYFEDEIDSQEYGRFIAESSYAFVPETFDWFLFGSFDQIRESLLRPVAPENLENVITVSTGPELTLRFGDAFESQAEAHYTFANYSERDFDSETVGASLMLGRRLSERTFIGLGGAFDDVSYDVEPGIVPPDYERREYYLHYDTEGARTTFSADVGYSEVTGVGVDDSGPMARARLTRRLTPFVSGFLAYTREFPTSTDSTFTPAPGQGELVQDASILTAAPRENESAEIGLLMERPRTTGMLMFARRREATLGVVTEEREYDEVTASLSRMITTRSSVGVYGIYTKEQLDDLVVVPGLPSVDVDADERAFGANMLLAFGRALGLEVRVEHRKRDSDAGIGVYEELSAGIFLRYGSAPRSGQSLSTP